jgi:hypothetical protein
MPHEFDDMDFQTAIQQTARRFEAEKSTAEHDCFARASGVLHDSKAIVERAKNKDTVGKTTRAGEALNRRHKRPRSGRKNESIVVFNDSVDSKDFGSGSIDSFDSNTRVQRDAVVPVPFQWI